MVYNTDRIKVLEEQVSFLIKENEKLKTEVNAKFSQCVLMATKEEIMRKETGEKLTPLAIVTFKNAFPGVLFRTGRNSEQIEIIETELNKLKNNQVRIASQAKIILAKQEVVEEFIKENLAETIIQIASDITCQIVSDVTGTEVKLDKIEKIEIRNEDN